MHCILNHGEDSISQQWSTCVGNSARSKALGLPLWFFVCLFLFMFLTHHSTLLTSIQSLEIPKHSPGSTFVLYSPYFHSSASIHALCVTNLPISTQDLPTLLCDCFYTGTFTIPLWENKNQICLQMSTFLSPQK